MIDVVRITNSLDPLSHYQADYSFYALTQLSTERGPPRLV